jgi:hypothetical protein
MRRSRSPPSRLIFDDELDEKLDDVVLPMPQEYTRPINFRRRRTYPHRRVPLRQINFDILELSDEEDIPPTSYERVINNEVSPNWRMRYTPLNTPISSSSGTPSNFEGVVRGTPPRSHRRGTPPRSHRSRSTSPITPIGRTVYRTPSPRRRRVPRFFVPDTPSP